MPVTTDAHTVDAGEAERLLVRAVAAAVVFVLAASVAVVLQRSDDDGPAGSGAAIDVPSGGAPLLSGYGPPPGEDVGEYTARRQVALRKVDGRAVAVVSFDRYIRGADLVPLLGRRTPVYVHALLVAPPGGEATVAQGSLGRWAARARAEARQERTALERLLLTTEDPDFVRQYHADIARLTAVLAHLDPAGELVFGAVVEGEADALRALARRDGVRLVDAVAEEPPERLSVLAGLRPEETATAGTPPTRPLPSVPSTGAPASDGGVRSGGEKVR